MDQNLGRIPYFFGGTIHFDHQGMGYKVMDGYGP